MKRTFLTLILASLCTLTAAEPWDSITTEQLRNWRGAIATAQANLPCGFRPNQSNNALVTFQIDSPCWSAADRQTAFAAYRQHGYTHWAMGPLVQKGYAGAYPDTDWRRTPDVFMDRLEEVWRAGFVPVVALLPDTGVCATGDWIDWPCVRRELEPIYRSPRFQKLARIVFPAWEPSNWSPDVWREASVWMADVFPNAFRYLHFESNRPIPCKGGDFAPYGFKTGLDCWRYARVDLVHGVMLQETWTWAGGDDTVEPGRTPEQQVLYNLWDAGRRLRGTHEGTPPNAAWGEPLDIIAFEYASYTVLRKPELAPAAIETGLKIMSPLAAFFDPLTGSQVNVAQYVRGYGDGGPPGVVRPPVVHPVTPPDTSVETAIRTAYRELLRRDADDFGLTYYRDKLASGWSVGQMRADIMASDEFILDSPLTYGFFIVHWRQIIDKADAWYRSAHNNRAPADSDLGHGLWRAISEPSRWGTLRKALQDTWPK